MHAIRTTPGLIIESRPYGEADKMLSIFTRDLGLVTATAQGIRFEKSKLRYHTQDHSLGTFSFVRGKEYWRLTSAEEQGARRKEKGGNGAEQGELMPRIALLLRRLLHGEEPHPELFECVDACSRFLDDTGPISRDELDALESLIVLRILHVLGYIGNDAALAPYCHSSAITPGLLLGSVSKRALINRHINKALRESHL